jgi:hypothetical protein
MGGRNEAGSFRGQTIFICALDKTEYILVIKSCLIFAQFNSIYNGESINRNYPKQPSGAALAGRGKQIKAETQNRKTAAR